MATAPDSYMVLVEEKGVSRSRGEDLAKATALTLARAIRDREPNARVSVVKVEEKIQIVLHDWETPHP